MSVYTEADRQTAHDECKKRWLVTLLPGIVLVLAGVVGFVIFQVQRLDWGWIFACGCTILGGSYAIFFYGVYLRPVLLYWRHLGIMLSGRKREVVGRLMEIAQETSDKDGISAYGVTVNIGERNDPEDERLFYYDAQLAGLAIPFGASVRIISSDRMIADIREI